MYSRYTLQLNKPYNNHQLLLFEQVVAERLQVVVVEDSILLADTLPVDTLPVDMLEVVVDNILPEEAHSFLVEIHDLHNQHLRSCELRSLG